MAPFFRNSFACLVAAESPPEKKLLLTTFGEVPLSFSHSLKVLPNCENFMVIFLFSSIKKYCFLFNKAVLDNATSCNKNNFIIFCLLMIKRSSIFLILKERSQNPLIFVGSPTSKLIILKFQLFRTFLNPLCFIYFNKILNRILDLAVLSVKYGFLLFMLLQKLYFHNICYFC